MTNARAQIPSEFNLGSPQLQVTTECTEDGWETQEISSLWDTGIRVRQYPNRIGVLPFEDSDSEDELTRSIDLNQFTDLQPPYERHDDRTPLMEAVEASQRATQEAVRAVGGELMCPVAKFHVEQEKSSCKIRFEPPVSGRFILLKMWHPQLHMRGNIDIQGVFAKGFAGPRYFPAMELR